MDRNGTNVSPSEQIAQSHEQIVDRKREWVVADREAKNAAKRKLQELRDQKYELMHQAGIHAGRIGLVYEPETNFFSRVVAVDQLPVYGDRPVLKPLELPTGPATVPEPAEEASAGASETFEAAAPATGHTDSPKTVASAPASEPRLAVERKRPEPPVLAESDDKVSSEPILKIATSWVFSLLIGAFVGYGMLTISGLPYQRPGQQIFLYLFIGLGIAAIGSMKFLFEALWKQAGRQTAMKQSNVGFYALALGVTMVLLVAEVYLGGFALVKYLEKTSFQSQGSLPQWQAMLVAASISTANLLFSAVLGFQKGQRSLSQADRATAAYQLAMKEYEADKERELRIEDEERAMDRRVRDREDELAAKAHAHNLALIDEQKLLHEEELGKYKARQELAEQHFQAGLQNREERVGDLEGFVKNTDYSALLQCIGSIKTITIQITELERASTNDSISRGHERRAQII